MSDPPPGPRRSAPAWRWQVPCLIALAALALSPALGTGYFAEDVLFSLIPGEEQVNGISIAEKAWAYSVRTLREGRFYPVTPLLQTVPFHVLRTPTAYKTYLVAATILDVLLFYAAARKLSGRAGFAALSGCLLVALFQFRVYPDPILAYYGQMQLVSALTLGSILMLLRHLEVGGRGWLIGAALAYLLSALTYEACYAMVAVPLLLIARSGRGTREKVAAALPFLLAVGACALATLTVRLLFPDEDHYIHRVSLEPVPALRGLLLQTSGALPMGYLLGDPLDLFPGPGDPAAMASWLARPRVALVAMATLLVCALGLRRSRVELGAGPGSDRRWLATTAGGGLLLAILPATLLSLSPYHRQSFSFGVGWVPVFVQSFGMALLLASATWAMLASRVGGPFARWKCLIASGLLAVVAGTTYRANEVAALAFNAPPGSPLSRPSTIDYISCWHFHRLNVEAALDAGLLDEVPDHSALLLANEYPVWHSAPLGPWFYRMHADKAVATYPPSAASQGQGPAPGQPSFRLRDVCLGRDSGFVVLSGADPEEGPLRLFVRHPDLFRHGRTPALLLLGLDPAGGEPRLRPGRDLPPDRSGPDWALFALDPAALAPNSLALVFDPAEAALLLRSAGLAPDSLAADPRPAPPRR